MSVRYLPLLVLLALVLALVLVSVRATAEPIQYRDWTVGTLVMILQSIVNDGVRIYPIGEVSDSGIFQAAMRIATDPDDEDPGTKNAILFECGMHAREWFAAESCYWLIDYLVRNRRTATVRELLQHADVWVIPQSNPAGRNIDDLMLGNPERFTQVCDSGPLIGARCTVDTDCDGTTGGGHCNTNGWRGNANLLSCPLGVDPARNFSSRWDEGPAHCLAVKRCKGRESGPLCAADSDCSGGETCDWVSMKYRGPAPFSERETLNLRRFVNNHMLSMVATLHTNGQAVANAWAPDHDPTDFMTWEVCSLNQSGSDAFVDDNSPPAGPDIPSPRMGYDTDQRLGQGHGQFSAWLTQPSNTVMVPGLSTIELDAFTERNISTFFFELPITGENYREVPGIYRDAAGDLSNSFHPSGRLMADVWDDTLKSVLTYLIRQARSPQCPVGRTGNPVTGVCEAGDFGLAGAKIGPGVGEPGALAYSADSREEILPRGPHEIVFAVQNFSAPRDAAPTSTSVQVKVIDLGVSPPATRLDTAVAIGPIDPGERQVKHVSYEFTPGAYAVTLALAADDFSGNNTRSFAFRVPSLVAAPYSLALGAARVRTQAGRGRLNYQAQFRLPGVVHPDTAGARIVVHGHAPYGTLPQTGDVATLALDLPAGSPWWDGSRKGVWVYRDPEGQIGPVRSLRIQQHAEKASPGYRTRVTLDVRGAPLQDFALVRSYSMEIGLPADHLRLLSVAAGKAYPLPPGAPSLEDDDEMEPGEPLQDAQ
jgi:hypothetical protein